MLKLQMSRINFPYISPIRGNFHTIRIRFNWYISFPYWKGFMIWPSLPLKRKKKKKKKKKKEFQRERKTLSTWVDRANNHKRNWNLDALCWCNQWLDKEQPQPVRLPSLSQSSIALFPVSIAKIKMRFEH